MTSILTPKARNWMRQELEMTRIRVGIHEGTTSRTKGNPMTRAQAYDHLIGVRKWIRSNPDLYPQQ